MPVTEKGVMIMEKHLRQSLEFAENIINTVREPLIALDQDLRVVAANRSFYEFFQVKPKETVGQLIYDLGNKQWNIPKLRELLETILPEHTTFDDYEVEHNFATIGRRTMLLNARQIEQAWGKERIILLAIEDITRRKAIEAGLETTRNELAVVTKIADAAHEFADSVINTVREPLISLDQDLRVVTVNRSFYDFFKVKPEETVGQLIYDLGNKQWDIPKLRELLENILPTHSSFDNYEVEHNFVTIGRRTMLLNARQIEQAMGKERIILLAIEDITERSRLEDLLEESEFRYRRLFETASDGIVLLEKKQGHVAYVNPAMEKMLGYSEAECQGKNLNEIGVPIDARDFSATMQDLQREGILNYEDIPLKTRTGKEIYTDIYMVNRAQLAQCNIRDVSERKQAEEKLTEEKNFIENALNTLTDVFFAFSLSGRFLRWNKSLNEVTGYLDTEIELMKPADLFRGDDIRKIAAAIQMAIEEGSVEVNALLVGKDGKQIPYAFNAALLRDTSANPIAICGTGRDITERIQREQDLRLAFIKAQEGETRWEAIMSSMGDGISIQDPDYIITYQNQALQDLVGDHIGEYCFTAYEDKDHICEGCPVEMAFNDGDIHKDERAVTVGKEIKYREVIASPLRDIHGEVVSVVEVIRDVTDQKKLESQLRHSQKMEAVGTLAGGVAHDFNNILSVIMGYGDMVMNTLATDSRARGNMTEVLVAAERAADLTKRLLVFSRKVVAEVKPIDINELILNLQKMLNRIIRENIEFHLDLTKTPLIALVDTGQIEQVLINLVSNAKDAMLDGGRLRVTTSIEEIDDAYITAYGYGQPGRYALIAVADTGQGMDAETQSKIFEPFFTTKKIGDGTGLGLAISYGIVKQHNGYIKVYSEPGEGTVFNIFLPLCVEAALNNKFEDASPPAEGGHETILVAEDEATLRDLSRMVLESFGYTVITADNGEEAIAKFLENQDRINLVLLDMIMPKKNGKEVGEAIRKVSPKMKILFSSGYTDEIVTNKEMREDSFEFIQKPYPPKSLLLKVREILDK